MDEVGDALLGVRVSRQILDGVRRTQNLIRISVRNLNAKLLFKRHHNLDRVKAVQAEFCKACLGRQLPTTAGISDTPLLCSTNTAS